MKDKSLNWNRITTQGTARVFAIPAQGGSVQAWIVDVSFGVDQKSRKAPQFGPVSEMVAKVLNGPNGLVQTLRAGHATPADFGVTAPWCIKMLYLKPCAFWRCCQAPVAALADHILDPRRDLQNVAAEASSP